MTNRCPRMMTRLAAISSPAPKPNPRKPPPRPQHPLQHRHQPRPLQLLPQPLPRQKHRHPLQHPQNSRSRKATPVLHCALRERQNGVCATRTSGCNANWRTPARASRHRPTSSRTKSWAKLVRRQREIEAKLATASPAPAPPSQDFEPLSYSPAVQEVIDSVPDLLAWQYDPNAQDRFQRATEYDKALMHDPDWKGKSPTERFAEAAERTKRAFGAAASPSPAPAPSPSAAAAAVRLDPAAAIAEAPASGPKGISDFRGGAPAAPTPPDYSPMSDEEVMASLTPS